MYQKHYSEHEPLKIVCDYCLERFRNKNDLDSHKHPLSGTCLEQPVDCIFKQAGCKSIEHSNSMDIDSKIKYLTRKNLDSHLALNQNEHLKQTYNFLNERIAILEKQTANYTDLIKFPAFQTVSSDRKVNDVKEASDVGFFEASDSRYQSSSSSSAQSIEKATVSATSTSPATSSMQPPLISSTFNKHLTDINMKLEILENNHKALVTDIARLQKMNDNFKQENLKYKESNKEYKTICQDLHRTLALTQVSLLTLEERLINQEKLSYNGTLLWKITNVQERIQEAKSGRQTSFYSPPFYTERNGFKMCARIYLNGDGNGRNTHLSLFFVILRGEYDALLKWPFRQKVTFILIDQSSSESKENVYDAFRPDPNSSSFRRPVSEMNIASGLPVFCPLGKLLSDDHEYIKDNTMFIKIIVDTKDLSEI